MAHWSGCVGSRADCVRQFPGASILETGIHMLLPSELLMQITGFVICAYPYAGPQNDQWIPDCFQQAELSPLKITGWGEVTNVLFY